MTERRSFAEILDECIDRVLTRGESIEACVRDFPEHADELRDALSAGVAAAEAFAFLPDPDRKRAARLRLHDAIDRKRSRRAWWRLPLAGAGRAPRLATVALVALLVVAGSSTGTVLAAQDSAPGELLYPVMRAGERVQLALAITDERESDLRARLMERRIRELGIVMSTGRERFVPDLVAQIERHRARAQGLAVARVRSIVETLPALDDSAPAAGPDHEQPGLTPGSPSRREVSVRRIVLLSAQIEAHRQRIARFESIVSEGPSRRELQRLREAMERTQRGLQELLGRADRAHQVRETDGGPEARPPDAQGGAHAGVETVRVAARIEGIKVVHDGRNLLGVDVSVVAIEDGTRHVAHLTRRGTKLVVDGRPGSIKQLRLDQAAVLIVDASTGEILELRIGQARPDTERVRE
ncbi:MAG: hypothetical protein IIA54_01920 [Chloroflexi bacterium]|nr:hypothetical protein [Chloroflexota bacterium]